jgi:hypothetical protein
LESESENEEDDEDMDCKSDENMSQQGDNEDADEVMLSELLAQLKGSDTYLRVFKDLALKQLIPLLKYTKELTKPGEKRAFEILTEPRLCMGSVLVDESRLWLASIKRRLSGRRRIRTPYYAEISRDIPLTVFHSLARVVKASPEFVEPFVFHSKNKKGEVLSFTCEYKVKRLFTILSALSFLEVSQFFKKTLTGKRIGGKARLIVKDTKDFSFVYRFSQGKLTIGFYFGEWNGSGFPQHN